MRTSELLPAAGKDHEESDESELHGPSLKESQFTGRRKINDGSESEQEQLTGVEGVSTLVEGVSIFEGVGVGVTEVEVVVGVEKTLMGDSLEVGVGGVVDCVKSLEDAIGTWSLEPVCVGKCVCVLN